MVDLTVAEPRFWPKVDRSAGPDACWVWTASLGPNGYGVFHVGKVDGVMKRMPAHRYSLSLALGEEIPSDLCALHRCDNRPCVNPAHLFVGTKRDNTLDMVAKGRHGYQQRTECKHGHPYAEGRWCWYVNPRGSRSRYCLACEDERYIARYGRVPKKRRSRRVA